MTATMISACERYFSALRALDRAAYLDAFSAGAEVRDPYGGRAFVGPDGLNKWFNGMERTWARFDVQPGEFIVTGNRVAVPWKVTAQAKNGKEARFDGINVFTVGEDGLLSGLEGYWDAQAMMDQIA
jgi:steroid delta-isomerase